MNRSRGFSMVEVVVSASLIAATLLVVFNLFPRGAASVSAHQSRMLAATLAESLLSKARADGWARVAPARGREALRGEYDGRALATTFDFDVTIDPVTPDLKLVSARLEWPDRGGRATLTMSTLVRRIGPAPP